MSIMTCLDAIAHIKTCAFCQAEVAKASIKVKAEKVDKRKGARVDGRKNPGPRGARTTSGIKKKRKGLRDFNPEQYFGKGAESNSSLTSDIKESNDDGTEPGPEQV